MKFRTYVKCLGGSSFIYVNASRGYEDVLGRLRERRGLSRPNVVIPSYVTARLYRATRAAGCEVKFYDVHGYCASDIACLRDVIDESTIAIVYMHYYGAPQRLEEVAELARRHDAMLIEDWAVTLVSAPPAAAPPSE